MPCYVGRVEVRVGPSERWAPVCGDGWGVREGMVSACARVLKYAKGPSP